jgi:hypothetical protein
VHTVALVVFDRIPAFEMAVPCEVFGTDRSAAGLPNYRLLVCAVEPGPLRAAGGITIGAPFGLPDLREADTIVVPAWRDPDEVPPDALLDPDRVPQGLRAVPATSPRSPPSTIVRRSCERWGRALRRPRTLMGGGKQR